MSHNRLLAAKHPFLFNQNNSIPT